MNSRSDGKAKGFGADNSEKVVVGADNLKRQDIKEEMDIDNTGVIASTDSPDPVASDEDLKPSIHSERVESELEESNADCKPPKNLDCTHVSSNSIYRYKSVWIGRGSCHHCKKPFASRKLAKKHMNKKHPRETMYQCPHCQYRVRLKNGLTRHLATIHAKDAVSKEASSSVVPDKKTQSEPTIMLRVMKCKYCFFETSSTSIRPHILSVHRVKSRLHRCRYCPFTTFKIVELSEHISEHDNMKKLSCSHCEYTTVRWQFLLWHYRFDHKFKDGEIDLHAEKARCINLVSRTVSPVTDYFFKEFKDNFFICDQCNFSTNNRKKLSSHITRAHLTHRDYFKREEKLVLEDIKPNLHEDSNASSDLQSECSQQSVERPKKYNCTKCDFVTIHETLYHEHLACDHFKAQSSQWFRCEYCSFVTNYAHSVKRHYNTVHIKMRNKICDPLPKKKTFICDFCDGAYDKKLLLRRHLNRDHDGDRPYNCTDCDYKSATRPELSRHMRLHF